jgi:hypothetical protein
MHCDVFDSGQAGQDARNKMTVIAVNFAPDASVHYAPDTANAATPAADRAQSVPSLVARSISTRSSATINNPVGQGKSFNRDLINRRDKVSMKLSKLKLIAFNMHELCQYMNVAAFRVIV